DLNAYIEKKNPMTLLKAFNLIKDKTDLNLVFCGGYREDSIWNGMQEYMQANQISSRVKLLFRVKDEERNWLLANAALFVTPSLFEGFGRTPVEAAICKIPVISTKETSLFEATQGLCNYVENATDEKELAELMLNIIENPQEEKQLEEIAKKLACIYQAENCAKLYILSFRSYV
ncbi:MAG TPA: glycosyl transferase group 1, partial [Treponema sp.]|nr:glycosyl transferase group 1 [Treponema sp.]